ncbi:hypothetical protein CEXT_51471 [Caerostris extrusa]|uniref:Uncharacterized protein n=1 Tax=Caerostris extrusa TaxID=172846 RepID=A0AAV4N838_CAEEX|nr:hypothetical protein CEXT_51471 [Caerostris extrusa]
MERIHSCSFNTLKLMIQEEVEEVECKLLKELFNKLGFPKVPKLVIQCDYAYNCKDPPFSKEGPLESKARKSDCHRLFTELALFTHDDISTESTAGALLIYKTQAAVPYIKRRPKLR